MLIARMHRTERRGWRHGGHRVRGQHRREDIDRVRATTTPSWVRERLGASSAVECRGQSRPAGCTAGLCDHIGCPWRSGEDAATSGRWLHQPLLTAASVCVALSPITLASRAHLAPMLHALHHPRIIICIRPLPSNSSASKGATTWTRKVRRAIAIAVAAASPVTITVTVTATNHPNLNCRCFLPARLRRL